MTEEVLRPYDLAKVSLAESSVVEQLRALTLKLMDEVLELNHVLDDLFRDMFEAIKVRFEKIRSHKREFEEQYRRAMLYLVRVGPGLEFRDIYARIYMGLLRFAEIIESTAFRAYQLALAKTSLPDDLVLGMQRFAQYIRDSLDSFSSATQHLFINANKSIEALDTVIKNEEECDALYMDLHVKTLNLNNASTMVVARELIEYLEQAIDTLLHVAEDLKWIALHRV